jgi:hypothetical protein
MGAGDYGTRAELAQTPDFLQRVTVAGMKYALVVQTEVGSGPVWTKRVGLASVIIAAAAGTDWRVTWPEPIRRLALAVASSYLFPGQNPATSEANLDTVVASVWNALSGVDAADTQPPP